MMQKNIRAKKSVWGFVSFIVGVQITALSLGRAGVKHDDWLANEGWWVLDVMKFVGLIALSMGLIWFGDGLKQEIREERRLEALEKTGSRGTSEGK